MTLSQPPMLQTYERALARLRRVEDDLLGHLGKVFAVVNDGESPTLRQLAFLEGLRRERDEALAAVHQAEAGVIDYISKLLGIPPDVTT